MSNDIESCDNCRYSSKQFKYDPEVKCRRRAPVCNKLFVTTGQYSEAAKKGTFPEMPKDEWCGEWKEKI